MESSLASDEKDDNHPARKEIASDQTMEEAPSSNEQSAIDSTPPDASAVTASVELESETAVAEATPEASNATDDNIPEDNEHTNGKSDDQDSKRKRDESEADISEKEPKRMRKSESAEVVNAKEESDPVSETITEDPENTSTLPETTQSAAPDATDPAACSEANGDGNEKLPSKTKEQSTDRKKLRNQKRWRAHQVAEDYVELASNMMLNPIHLGPYGYDDKTTVEHQSNGESVAAQPRKYPLELISSLGFLKSPLRRPTVIEKWSPYEISLFEAGMGHYGKEFHEIQKLIQTKSTKECIDFYYIWKKTSHYKAWKESYVQPMELVAEEEYGTTPVKKTGR
ncbi:induction early response protein 1 [Seminavis robusta]|uniref:Induction early response protein 1 n=1 Tax=Seminavis robusta TaxID=568900 RepID=A0A9N8DE16_9STRA|nr:induction early response protein 1 [Seminavis robusta]|eukprot:Sro104_g052910.1 induction early response protein 1 (341) ;mRNA; r:73563-74711